jgi:hypothetical protein
VVAALVAAPLGLPQADGGWPWRPYPWPRGTDPVVLGRHRVGVR